MKRKPSVGKKKDRRAGVKRDKHNVPDEVDIKLWNEDFLKHSKSLDERGCRKPLTEKELVAWVRRKLDEVWMRCPQKLAFLAMNRKPDYDPDSRRSSYWECNICKGAFSGAEVQVDHRSGEHEFTQLSQLEEFANKRFMVGYEDLQVLCLCCHQLKTHGERYDLTLEEAKIDKAAIAIQKNKQDVAFLKAKGYNPGSNAKLRKAQLIEILTKEKEDES